MTIHVKDFFKIYMAVCAMGLCVDAVAAQSASPRSTTNTIVSQRNTSSDMRRDTSSDVVSRTAVRRGVSVVNRGTTNTPSGVVPSNGRTAPKVRNSAPIVSRDGVNVARNAAGTNVVRSATVPGASVARGAKNGVSHKGQARATAVFDDVSKMGTGYATCRDAYATCMDQLCAKANDTYRRCFCSSRFADFHNTEAALDKAKTLLMQFEDNSLNAVDKTAAEVNAMYSATVGEAAIKKDTSSAQKTLSEISDLLAGKKKVSTATSNSTSLGMLSLDFSADVDDIWGDTSGDGLFGMGSTDLSQLEGLDLYNRANSQCLKIISDSCSDKAVLNMARSSYGILITQDCNAYEKKIESQREAVKQTARQAEKYLRDARLEEYRAHNSADVNECIAKVTSAMTTEAACGTNYKRCLDYTGAYVNPATGEAVYSPRLFKLTDIILLNGETADVLKQNPNFNTYLDSKRMFAATALDSCRDMANIVWEEFKRSALIEIAQTQDELIEKVKMSCVSTMKECYDTQSDALKSFDDTTAQAAGAISAYAAKAMCQDKVIACASLYGDTSDCTFDGNGKLTAGNDKSGNRCGLSALLAYVDAVDTVRVAEGCSGAIENYVKELCTPTTGDMGFPWNCRKKLLGSISAETFSEKADASIADNIRAFAVNNCSDPTSSNKTFAGLPVQTRTQVTKSISDIAEQLEFQLMSVCEEMNGFWQDASDTSGVLLSNFYTTITGAKTPGDDVLSWGRCVENTTMVQCLNYNSEEENDKPLATYNKTTDECVFTDKWYEQHCTLLGKGYYENGICYVSK